MVVNLPVQTEEKVEPGLIARINTMLANMSSVPADEKLFFVQHLGVMLKAGVSLAASLRTLVKQTQNKRLAGILEQMVVRVEQGSSFADSLRPHEKIFGELFINMVEAGEISGKLETVLGQLFTQMKKHHKMVSKIKGAMTYPLVILFAMSGIGVFMMIFVVPKITEMLTSFNTELPIATRILIGVSGALVNNGPMVLLGLIIVVVAIVKVLKTYRGKYLFQKALLNLPIFGEIIKKVNIASFARTVSSLLKTDIMIIKTFQITASTLGNLHYREALNNAAESIRKGVAVNEVIGSYPDLFPPLIIQMIAIGEQTGELDDILSELAEFYEEEVDQIMETLPSIIEPVLILVMGMGVAGVALAIITPMYSLTDSV
jgi:type IV pilus assembly protein PilC